MRRTDSWFSGVLPAVFIAVCALDTPTMRRPRPEFGCSGTERNAHTVSEQTVSRPIFEIVTSRIEVRRVSSKCNCRVHPKTSHEASEEE